MTRPPTQRRRLELLHAGLDLMEDGVAIFDEQARLAGWNDRFFGLLGLPRALARAGTPREAFGDLEAIARAGQGLRLRRKWHDDGSLVVLCRAEPVGYDQGAEPGQALDAIASARLQRITDSIPANIAYVDKELVYRFANRGYAAWFGETKESIIGKTIREVVGEPLFASVEPYLDLAASGRHVTYEYSMARSDGKTVFGRSSTLPDLAPGGEAIGFFILALDITEQKKAEAALVQAQKMEAIGQLTGGIAHDFNNLLTIIIGNLTALQERQAPQPEQQDYIDPALQAAQRGAELIKRLLTFARQRPLEPRPVEVGKLALGMSQFLRRSLPETVSIITKLHEKPQYAMADPHQLESALLNLALNARDAMPNGGQLRIETSVAELDEEAARELEVGAGDYVQVTVTDTGAGMDAQTVSRVFEPFFTTKRFGTGSGLGLSMVYGFVKQSGGGIRVQSELGRGTTMAILLPRCGAPQASADTAPAHGPMPLSGARRVVLLVEDEPQVRRIIRLHLTDLGYAVIEAHNAAEAVHMIEHVPEIAILISDIVMPGSMDGRELARFARFHRPDLRIVLITGHAEGVAGAHALDVPVLRKPFSRDEIGQALKNVSTEGGSP